MSGGISEREEGTGSEEVRSICIYLSIYLSIYEDSIMKLTK
jgi:hypothetical protein